MSQCPNCLAELAHEYCARCGQRRIKPEELSARHFLDEVVDEITTFRAKFKTLRSLRGLLTPGLLTAEYLAGRRQPYLSPFKLYLVCAAIFFLTAPMAGFRLTSLMQADRSGVLHRLVSARIAERDIDGRHFNARFDVRAQSVYTIALGLVSIVFALALQLLFRKQHRPYGAHLVFALHYMSFVYLLTVVSGVGRGMGLSTDAAAAAGYLLLMPYLFFGLKRVYSESRGVILLRGVALLLVSIALNSLANFAAIRLTLELA
jgi:hypothetical protein